MFSQLRKETNFMKRCKNGEKLTFVDLGSGDGRIVFRAVRENLFQSCIGYELNPMLHIYACIQRILYGPLAWHGTRFYLRDLWYVNLRSNADVVVVVRVPYRFSTSNLKEWALLIDFAFGVLTTVATFCLMCIS